MSISLVIPFDEKAARISARLFGELRRQGHLIGNQDILIASICLANGLDLFTHNRRYFTQISVLTLYEGTGAI